MFKSLYFIFCVAFFMLTSCFYGQVNSSLITIKQAESLSYDSEKTSAKILHGNVIAEHNGSLLHCDTALFFEADNKIFASGHILITKGDSIRVTGDKLIYDGKIRMAFLENNVKCIEKDMILTTNFLTFDAANSIANYTNGGKIVNKQNTLTSKNGHYYSSSKEAAFHFDVMLINPDYKMNCDTLRYRIPTKTAFFLGPSIILSKQDYIYCENGWYDTNKDKAQFSKNSILITSQQKLKGDSLFYDRKLKVGRAFRNVTLIDTSKKSIIYGDYIEYKEKKSEALVTKNALYARIFDLDTLFVSADTLYHIDVDSIHNTLNAYHHVMVYKKNLQAICDSSSMTSKDSLLQLFYNPVLWSNLSQATAKKINIVVGKKSVKSFKLEGKSFLIQQVDSTNPNLFNQLLGKIIEGEIQNDTIRRINVSGNAEIMYYIKNKNKMVGLDKTNCSKIDISFKSGDIERVSLYPNTKGLIDPFKNVDIENARLKGFNWLYSKRPLSRFSLNRKTYKIN